VPTGRQIRKHVELLYSHFHKMFQKPTAKALKGKLHVKRGRAPALLYKLLPLEDKQPVVLNIFVQRGQEECLCQYLWLQRSLQPLNNSPVELRGERQAILA